MVAVTDSPFPRMVFSLPISDEPGMHRGVLEHGDGWWSVVKFRLALAKSGASRVVTEESKFNFDQAAETAARSVSNKPGITKMQGRQMSAAFLTLLVGLGAIKLEDLSDAKPD